MSLVSGTKLGPYEIVGPLGAGGMGEVYRARDTRLERTVAIKILPAHLSCDPVRKQRFEREAKTISNLNHPHICVLYDIGSQDGVDYLVMECVEGETLAKRLEKGPLALEQVLKYGAQIADALDKAHRAGIVHRDLKPGNIMLTSSGAKLLDFGLAKPTAALVGDVTLTAAAPVASVTQEGMVVGTFQYMSPEQVEGKELDAPSDIFSLGAVLYEMLTGQRAFEGKSQLSVATAILEKEPEPISAVKPMTPPALDHSIRRCLAKDRNERWQSARDLAMELEWIKNSAPDVTAAPGRSGVFWHLPLWLASIVLLFLVVAAFSWAWFLRTPSRPYWKLPVAPPRVFAPGGNAIEDAAMSSDGSRIIYFLDNDLYVSDILGSVPQRLTSDGSHKTHPRWAADGSKITFTRVSDGSVSVFVMDLPAGIPRLVLRDAENAEFSPDGKLITVIHPKTHHAAVHDQDGNQLADLGEVVTAWRTSVSWSPDGKMIAAVRQSGPIELIRPDGSRIATLPTTRHSFEAVFTPDGKYLIVNHPLQSLFQLFQVPVSGGPLVPFSVGRFEPSSVTISADGSKLLVGAAMVEGHIHIGRLASATASTPLTPSSSQHQENPAISPDQKRVAFNEFGQSDGIRVVNMADGSSQLISGKGGQPAWSSDSSTVVWMENDNLVVLRLDEGRPTTIQLHTSGSRRVFPSFSSDGQSVLFTAYDKGGDAGTIWQTRRSDGLTSPLTPGQKATCSPVAPLFAFYRGEGEKYGAAVQVVVRDLRTGEERVLVSAESFATSKLTARRPLRWTADGKALLGAVEGHPAKIDVSTGRISILPFSFPLPLLFGNTPEFDVFSDGRIVFVHGSQRLEQWLFDQLQ